LPFYISAYTTLNELLAVFFIDNVNGVECACSVLYRRSDKKLSCR